MRAGDVLIVCDVSGTHAAHLGPPRAVLHGCVRAL